MKSIHYGLLAIILAGSSACGTEKPAAHDNTMIALGTLTVQNGCPTPINYVGVVACPTNGSDTVFPATSLTSHSISVGASDTIAYPYAGCYFVKYMFMADELEMVRIVQIEVTANETTSVYACGAH